MTRAEGDSISPVSAQNQDGETIQLTFEEPTVCYFYPRDATPGCSTEARQFEAERETYEDAGVSIYGISTDDVDSHQDFCEAEGLEFDLLADPDGKLADVFDVERRNGATLRTTFFLADGTVQRVYEDVDPDGHARDVLADALAADLVTLPE